MPSAPESVATATALARLVEWYQQLSPARLAELPQHYQPDARFKDPFNEVQGHASITHIFRHMFSALEAPRFTVLTQVAGGDGEAFLTWDFDFSLRGRPLRIHGATHLRFGPDGRVALHRDYWDAAEELYAKLPLLGGPMRWLQRRLQS